MNSTSHIPEEEKELYIYGFYMVFSYTFYCIFAALLGVIFHLLAESILFFLLFSLIRSYAGGVHASTEISCMICTSLSFLASVAAIRLGVFCAQPVAAFAVLAAGSVIILAFAPLDTPEKRLDRAERKHYRKLSYLILVTIITLAILSYVIRRYSIFYACTTSLGLEGTLLFIGHLKDGKHNHNANSLLK
jgi:accessory gene regulator B